MQYCFQKNELIENKLNQYLESVSAYFVNEFKNEISVLLLGSLSRGEGSWVKIDEKVKLISDIEYFIIYDLELYKYKKKIDTRLKDLQLEVFGLDTTNMFHIDYTYIKRNRIHSLERKLFVYEAAEFGKLICGKNCVDLFPKVTIKNINLFDIKDIINHRIFSILYYGKWNKNKLSNQEYVYTLAKNGLDLLTIFLCNLNILEAGFNRRLAILNNMNVDDNTKEFFNLCGKIKLYNSEVPVEKIQYMEKMFLQIATRFNDEFVIKSQNVRLNIKSLIRRFFGILKRSINQKSFRLITPKKHFQNMRSAFIGTFIKEDKIKICKQQYILYGFISDRVND